LLDAVVFVVDCREGRLECDAFVVIVAVAFAIRAGNTNEAG